MSHQPVVCVIFLQHGRLIKVIKNTVTKISNRCQGLSDTLRAARIHGNNHSPRQVSTRHPPEDTPHEHPYKEPHYAINHHQNETNRELCQIKWENKSRSVNLKFAQATADVRDRCSAPLHRAYPAASPRAPRPPSSTDYCPGQCTPRSSSPWAHYLNLRR